VDIDRSKKRFLSHHGIMKITVIGDSYRFRTFVSPIQVEKDGVLFENSPSKILDLIHRTLVKSNQRSRYWWWAFLGLETFSIRLKLRKKFGKFASRLIPEQIDRNWFESITKLN
jgi:hypothetical protein